MIIAFEGIDGAGKNTVVTALEKELIAREVPVARLAFPRYEASVHAQLASAALHGEIRELTGRDHLLIYCRIDMVENEGRLEVLEVNLMDVTLYLSIVDGALERFADAIAVRAFW